MGKMQFLFVVDKLLSNWTGFLNLSEECQARFLLDIASAAWKNEYKAGEIKAKVETNLLLGYQVLEGDFISIPLLIRFLEDPNMKEDFGSYFEQIKHIESASAALELASYACGFVCRLAAQKAKIRTLPDPVIESIPELYEYYKDRAEFLSLTKNE